MNELIEKLKNAPIGLDDYTDYLEDALDCIDELDDQKAVFKEAFLFFETHSNADLGMPGPLVHFLENFIQSIWMNSVHLLNVFQQHIPYG